MRSFTILLVMLGVLALAGCAPQGAPSVRLTPTLSAPTVTAISKPTLQPTGAIPMPTSSSPDTATLRVTATIGPTCPGPQREGQTCTGPYSGEFTLTDRAGNELQRFTTDAEGHYTLQIAPGEYRVGPTTAGGKMVPRGAPVDVSLTAGQTVEIMIELDSGMR